MEDRFNTPSTRVVEIEVMGHAIRLAQDPNTKHVGTTVWDSSMVVAKYLERNSRSGEFARARVKGKRAVELGAGCGLAGMGFALLGCDVVLTDQSEVLPLLQQNVERNGSAAQMACAGDPFLGRIGKMAVAELDWGNRDHIAATEPPFDFIVGTDVVYVEDAVEELFDTMLRLSGRKTVILLGYEFRSSTVHERLHELCRLHWNVKKVPPSKLDPQYQHAAIDLYVMKRKRSPLQLSVGTEQPRLEGSGEESGAYKAPKAGLERMSLHSGDPTARGGAVSIEMGGRSGEAEGANQGPAEGEEDEDEDDTGKGGSGGNGAEPPCAVPRNRNGQDTHLCSSIRPLPESTASGGVDAQLSVNGASFASQGQVSATAVSPPGQGERPVLEPRPDPSAVGGALAACRPASETRDRARDSAKGEQVSVSGHTGDGGLSADEDRTRGEGAAEQSWEARRAGAMAARLMAEVKVPTR